MVKKTQFKPGKSGNPKGRPPGIIDRRTAFKKFIEKDAEAIIKKTVKLAKDGDIAAIRLCIDRIIPPIRSKDEPVNIPNLDGGKTLTEQAQIIITAIGLAEISPTEGTAVLTALASKARIDEIDELERRIKYLEGKSNVS